MTHVTMVAAARSCLRMAPLASFLAASLAVAAASAAVPNRGVGLRFDEVFNERGEPPLLHYQARYRTPHGPHSLEVWRDGERRLVRRTDDTIETHIVHSPGDPGFQMVVLDLKRKIETKITRDDLFRIGHFTEWSDLAHGLRHPRAAYRLTKSVVPFQAPASIEPCSWYALEQGDRSTTVCWSARVRLPLILLDGTGHVLWQVTEIDGKPAAADVFKVRDVGFVRNDADRDISDD